MVTLMFTKAKQRHLCGSVWQSATSGVKAEAGPQKGKKERNKMAGQSVIQADLSPTEGLFL